jgi:hypothetical protein
MATDQSSGRNPSRNPSVTSIEPATVTVAPDFDTGGVSLEVVDRAGRGFATVLDQAVAIDVTLRIVGAIGRLRGYGGEPS